MTLTATIKPENSTNKYVIWESSNQDVATVSAGVITANNVGKTTIIATAEGGSNVIAMCNITVTEVADGSYSICKNYG